MQHPVLCRSLFSASFLLAPSLVLLCIPKEFIALKRETTQGLSYRKSCMADKSDYLLIIKGSFLI